MPEAHDDPLARLRAAAAARAADFMAATRALEAVRDHVRTASAVGRK
jgi:hypothetical protein